MARSTWFAGLAAWAMAGAAAAGAPPPASAVPASLYSGRWYDIAHTPNSRQRNCQAPTNDFTGSDGAALALVQTCHKGSPGGPVQMFRAKARIVAGSGAARFRVAFLGGLVSQEYWILDYAGDGGWAIMATPGGHYVWLLSRAPVLDPAARARALSRIAALGYGAAHLAFPRQQSR